ISCSLRPRGGPDDPWGARDDWNLPGGSEAWAFPLFAAGNAQWNWGGVRQRDVAVPDGSDNRARGHLDDAGQRLLTRGDRQAAQRRRAGRRTWGGGCAIPDQRTHAGAGRRGQTLESLKV